MNSGDSNGIHGIYRDIGQDTLQHVIACCDQQPIDRIKRQSWRHGEIQIGMYMIGNIIYDTLW